MIYPLGIPVNGSALNFTMISNKRNLGFGIVAWRQSVPHVQRFIEYLEESLQDVEGAVAA